MTVAQQRLGGAGQACLWGLLVLLWTPWAWWAAPLGLIIAFTAYLRALGAAVAYGDIFVSCFDVHRELLYRALRWPLPASPAQEPDRGLALSAYLERGSSANEPRFVTPESEP
ncbi:hypothetical protein ACFU53_29655 [Streptomyces sp. NPDC057474]|uniref:hypothetical protein n=1 Tax=Streptomyces sp. NPDC057474 TaxID=3346144 RepID=UPI0036C5A6A1